MKLLERLRAHFTKNPPAAPAEPLPVAEPEIVYIERFVAVIENRWTHRNPDGTGAFKQITQLVAAIDPEDGSLADARERVWKMLP